MKRFTAPKIISPFFSEIKRLPRKTKKDLNKLIKPYNFLTLEQRMWYRLNVKNSAYTNYLISEICK